MSSEELRSLFEEYVSDADIYPSGWKHIVMRLQRIANHDPRSPFDENARYGFNYLDVAVMNRICDECGDLKAFEWMKAFAQAWLDGVQLPQFHHSCETS
jgi:hypothetical protein